MADPSSERATLEVAVRREDGAPEPDRIVVEEALEIRLQGRPLAVTLRTPGDDHELVLGFLFAEGIIDGPDDVVGASQEEAQIFDVELTEEALDRWARRGVEREFRITSACGACGRPRLEDVERDLPRVRTWEPPLELVRSLPDRLRAEQRLFDLTGGCHAAALFDRDGGLIACFEDVGRHNAVDKIVGHALLAGRPPLTDTILLVSGRGGFELVEKAAFAGIPVLAAVGATTSAAVAVARRSGLALYCFVRSDRAVRIAD